MAMLILVVGMLGLLQSVNLAVEMNLRNQLRDEAVTVGERSMNELRGKGFDNISVASVPTDTVAFKVYSVPSRIRGASRKYAVARTSKVLSLVDGKPVTKELTVTVTWNYKGVTYENRVVSPTSILR